MLSRTYCVASMVTSVGFPPIVKGYSSDRISIRGILHYRLQILENFCKFFGCCKKSVVFSSFSENSTPIYVPNRSSPPNIKSFFKHSETVIFSSVSTQNSVSESIQLLQHVRKKMYHDFRVDGPFGRNNPPNLLSNSLSDDERCLYYECWTTYLLLVPELQDDSLEDIGERLVFELRLNP